MKKFKVTLKPGSVGKKISIFPTVEALYVWCCALERGEAVQVGEIEELVLEPGGFIEAELMGFEYAHEGRQKFRRCDLIRFGKAQQPQNSSGLLVTIHQGWVSGGLLPMKAYSDADIEVRPIHDSESRLDLRALFNEDPLPEPSYDIDPDEEDTGDPEDDFLDDDDVQDDDDE